MNKFIELNLKSSFAPQNGVNYSDANYLLLVVLNEQIANNQQQEVYKENITMVIQLIKTKKDYQKALKMLDTLFNVIAGTFEGDILDILSLLIQKYD